MNHIDKKGLLIRLSINIFLDFFLEVGLLCSVTRTLVISPHAVKENLQIFSPLSREVISFPTWSKVWGHIWPDNLLVVNHGHIGSQPY